MFIPVNELEDRRIYRIKSRNLLVGAWSADQGAFIGVRLKFSSRFLDSEYADWTANALEALDVWVPDEIPMKELLYVECKYCFQKVESIFEFDPEFKPNKGMRCVGDRHVDSEAAELCEYDGTYCGQWKSNKALFDLLDPYDQKFEEERRREYGR